MEYDTLKTFIDGEIPAELPTGWRQTFAEMISLLKKCFDDENISPERLYFLQIKEKYGEMRIYTFYEDDVPDRVCNYCSTIIDVYSRKTRTLCHKCGAKAYYCSNNWILPWCKSCGEEEAKKINIPIESIFSKIG